MGTVLGNRACLCVASLSITVHSPDLPLWHIPEPAYEPFLCGSGTAEGAVTVTVSPGLAAPPPEAQKLFDTGQSWSVFGDGRRTILFRDPSRPERTLWTAAFGLDDGTMTIRTGAGMLRREKGIEAVETPFRYPLDQLFLMYRLRSDGAILHAAGAVRNGRAAVFAGVSGAGKSTLTRLLLEQEGWRGLSDDRVILRRRDERLYAFGTPWPGDARVAANRSAPLSALCFIVHGRENRLRELTAAEAVARLLPVVSLPWYDRETLAGFLDTCTGMIGAVPAWELSFSPGPAAAAMVGTFLDEAAR